MAPRTGQARRLAMLTKTRVDRQCPGERLRATLSVRDSLGNGLPSQVVAAGDPLPSMRLAGQDGLVDVAAYSAGWLLVWCFPGDDCMPWSVDEVTARSFEERRLELEALGCALLGVSSQDNEVLAQFASRAKATYVLLSDPRLNLAHEMRLPTLWRDGQELYRRLVFIARAGHVARVFYRVRPLTCVAQAVGWLLGQAHREGGW